MRVTDPNILADSTPPPLKPLPFGCACLSKEMGPAISRLTKESPRREREGVVLLLLVIPQQPREPGRVAARVPKGLRDSVPKWHAPRVRGL